MEINNPGKYDDACTVARKSTEADSAVLIIVGGKLGSGFSIQATRGVLIGLPDLLEFMAKEIRKDLGKTL